MWGKRELVAATGGRGELPLPVLQVAGSHRSREGPTAPVDAGSRRDSLEGKHSMLILGEVRIAQEATSRKTSFKLCHS